MNRFFPAITIVLLLSVSPVILGQEAEREKMTFEFRGAPLHEVLDQIINRTDIDLVYDPQLTQGIYIYNRITTGDNDELLRRLLKEHQLDFITLSSGTYVIVRTAAEGPFYGTFTGKIVDGRTGDPLPGATVMLADASGGTNANRSGNFSLNRVISGKHQIIFSYVGYEPVYKIIDIPPNEEITERVALAPKPVNITPIIVEAHRPLMPNQNSVSTGSQNSDWETIGMMNDPIRDLSLMPGVQYGLPLTDLNLQGGQRGEHRILLDGVPVYNPYSFGQMFSSFSPFAIDKVTVHKAGYGVNEGSQIAGLLDLSHDLPASGSNSATLQADPLSLNFRGDLSFPNGDDSSFDVMTALRTNFWDLYKNPTLEETLRDWDVMDPLITNLVSGIEQDASLYSPVFHDSDVKFFDFHTAARYQVDDFKTISGSFYLAENAVETRLLNENPTVRYNAPFIYVSDSYDWQNLMGQISWNQMVTPRFDLSLQASYSSNQFEHLNQIGTSHEAVFLESAPNHFSDAAITYGRAGGLLPTKIDGNSIEHFTLNAEGAYSFSPNYSIQAGLQGDRILSNLIISDIANLTTQTDQSSTLLSTYLNNRHTLGRYWSIDWGSRFTYTTLSNNIYPEPRFSVQLDKPDSRAGFWSARVSGGLYRQFINEHQITNTGPTALVPSFAIWSHAGHSNIPKAWHLNGSFMIEPAENTTLVFESHYKWQPVTTITSYGLLNFATASNRNLSVIGEHQNDVRAFAETTDMTVFGGGLRVNQALFSTKLKLVAGYDYSYSRVNMETQFGRSLPAPWNDPHLAQFRALWRVMPDFTVVAKWQGIWGRTWAFRESYYNFLRFRSDATNLPYSFDTPENDTLPPFHQVDLSFIYQPSIGPSNLEIRVELINLLNRANTLEKTLMPVILPGQAAEYNIKNRTLPGFYPTASIQVAF